MISTALKPSKMPLVRPEQRIICKVIGKALCVRGYVPDYLKTSFSISKDNDETVERWQRESQVDEKANLVFWGTSGQQRKHSKQS